MRAKKRQIVTQRGLIIAQGEVSIDTGRDVDVIINREQAPGYYPAGIDNPVVIANPPSYEEVQRTKTMEEKPPSYEQVVSGNFQPGNNGINTDTSRNCS